jgi:hypothetical protein
MIKALVCLTYKIGFAITFIYVLCVVIVNVAVLINKISNWLLWKKNGI